MFGHVEVEDPPAIVGEDDQDEEDAQARGGDREEIEGDQVRTWLARKLRQVCRAWASGPRKLMKIVLG